MKEREMVGRAWQRTAQVLVVRGDHASIFLGTADCDWLPHTVRGVRCSDRSYSHCLVTATPTSTRKNIEGRENKHAFTSPQYLQHPVISR